MAGGLLVAGAITVLVSAVAYTGFLRALTDRPGRLVLLWLPAFPLSAGVNLLVKRPIGTAVATTAGVIPEPSQTSPWWYLGFLLLLSPITEEVVKLAPAVLTRVRSSMRRPRDAFWVGMSIGIGFGLGEAAYLAVAMATHSQYVGLPFFAFSGFFIERLAVCFGHGVMTAMALAGLAAGGRHRFTGPLWAVTLHALGNVGALGYQSGLVGAQAATLAFGATLVLLTWVFERARRTHAHRSHAEVLFEARPAKLGESGSSENH